MRVTNKLDHNISKFDYIIHGHTIEPVEEAKYLGVTINNKLNWNSHINNICQKANNTLNFINRNFKTCPQKIKEQLYTSYVRPLVEFSGSVWDVHTKINIDQIERVQRRAARFVKSSYGRDQSVTCMIEELGWPLLRERRARAKVTVIFKAKKDMIDIRLDMPNTLSSLRSATAQNHFIPFAHTNVYLFSFYQSALRIWNGLPPSIRESTTLANFQSAIKGRILTPPD